MAGGQMEFGIPASARIGQGFKRWRGTHQQTRRLRKTRPHHRHVARMVNHAFFLLEGGFMLLIHNDQAKIGKGEE